MEPARWDDGRGQGTSGDMEGAALGGRASWTERLERDGGAELSQEGEDTQCGQCNPDLALEVGLLEPLDLGPHGAWSQGKATALGQ